MDTYAGVLGRNQTLFHCVFYLYYHIQSAVVQNPTKGGAYAHYIDLSGIFSACMSPSLNGSCALQHFEHGNMVELCNRIMFDFYPGLSHM